MNVGVSLDPTGKCHVGVTAASGANVLASYDPVAGVLTSAETAFDSPAGGATLASSPQEFQTARQSTRTLLAWNDASRRAVANTSTPPTSASRIYALTMGAAYDAVNGIERLGDSFLVPADGPIDASPVAAMIEAAYQVSIALLPTQRATFDLTRSETLAQVADGAAKATGIAFGQSVAQRILAARADDGSNIKPTYTFGTAPGTWQMTPGVTAPLAPQWGSGDAVRGPIIDDISRRPAAGAGLAGIRRRLRRGQTIGRHRVERAHRGRNQSGRLLGRRQRYAEPAPATGTASPCGRPSTRAWACSRPPV